MKIKLKTMLVRSSRILAFSLSVAVLLLGILPHASAADDCVACDQSKVDRDQGRVHAVKTIGIFAQSEDYLRKSRARRDAMKAESDGRYQAEAASLRARIAANNARQIQEELDKGKMYEAGKGEGSQQQQDEEAISWYQKAAAHGSEEQVGLEHGGGGNNGVWPKPMIEEAQNRLKAMYRLGKGEVSRDSKELRLYLEAIEDGNAEVQIKVGWMYETGSGNLPRNIDKAIYWYQKAAEQGSVDALVRLGEVYSDTDKAAYWYQKAAEKGSKDAQYALGAMYEDGKGVIQNAANAIEWYQKAAEGGIAKACLRIAIIYGSGKGVPRDDAKAIAWLQKAADRGVDDAKEILQRIQAEEIAAKTIPDAAPAGAILVKGLWIGMNINTVPAILKEKLAGKKNCLGMDVVVKDVQNGLIPGSLCVFVLPDGGVITAGADRKVNSISLSAPLVGLMFNADNMEASAFVKEFMNAYKIPSMKPSDNWQNWIYTSEDGVKVTISQDKSILIEKAASKSESKFSFD